MHSHRLNRYAEGLIATLLIVLFAAPAAWAAGDDGAKASANSSVVKTLGKLRQQVSALQKQVAALQDQNGGPRAPSGPAGGDLVGAFPNPLLGPNTVGTGEVQPNAITESELAENSVASNEIRDGNVTSADVADGSLKGGDFAGGSIGSFQILDSSVFTEDLGNESVGGLELKAQVATVGTGVTITSNGGPANAQVTCPVGRVLIGGGYAWNDDEANSIIASAPSEQDPSHTWIVRGLVPAGSNTLYAWANCLLP